jgi:hypothetical protein
MNIASDVAYGAYEITTSNLLSNSYRIGNNIENKIGVQISYATPATPATISLAISLMT